MTATIDDEDAYNQADFDIGNAPIHCAKSVGVKILSAVANRMLVAITDPDFTLEMKGFDLDRDLYVKAEVKEDVDVDTAN